MARAKDRITDLRKEWEFTLKAWRGMAVVVRNKYPNLDAINEHYKALIEAEQLALSTPKTEQPSAPEQPSVEVSDEEVRSSGQLCTLRNWQARAANTVYHKIAVENKSAVALISGTGTGKTYMIGNVVGRLLDSGWVKARSISPYPVMICTKASVVEQFKRDLEYEFGIKPHGDVFVTNYDQLRSSFGKDVLSREMVIYQGKETWEWKWKPILHPRIIIWDESHSLKNEDSEQSQIAQAVNELPEGKITQVFVSATPWTRIQDCKCFTCGSRINYGA